MDLIRKEEILSSEKADFIKKTQLLISTFRLQDQTPSPPLIAELHQEFQRIYPNKMDFIEDVFAKHLEKASQFNLPLPVLPSQDILDLFKEPMAGLGRDFFLRLVYLDNLVNKAAQEIREAPKNFKSPLSPTLELLDAATIFETIKQQSIDAFQGSIPNIKQRTGFLARVFGLSEPSVQPIHVAACIEKRVSPLVTGPLRLSTIQLSQSNGLSLSTMAVLELTSAQELALNTGDVIGIAMVTPSKKETGYFKADALQVLVPSKLHGYLKHHEPSFAIVSDFQHDKKFVVGKFISFDFHTMTIKILDRHQEEQLVRVDSSMDKYGLNKGDIFVAVRSELGRDGIYSIRPNDVLKLQECFGNRLMNGKPKTVQNNNILDVFPNTQPS